MFAQSRRPTGGPHPLHSYPITPRSFDSAKRSPHVSSCKESDANPSGVTLCVCVYRSSCRRTVRIVARVSGVGNLILWAASRHALWTAQPNGPAARGCPSVELPPLRAGLAGSHYSCIAVRAAQLTTRQI